MNRNLVFWVGLGAALAIVVVACIAVGLFPLKFDTEREIETRFFEAVVTEKTFEVHDVYVTSIIYVQLTNNTRTLVYDLSRSGTNNFTDDFKTFFVGDHVLVEVDSQGIIYSIKHVPLFEVEQ